MNSNITTSLLTKIELESLLGNIQLSGSCHRKIKSQIRKKINNFEKFELPLLIEKDLMSFSSVTKFGNGVTKYSNTEIHSSSSNNENSAQMKSLERDLIPRPFPYQGWVTCCLDYREFLESTVYPVFDFG
jgi:hypothetical protein